MVKGSSIERCIKGSKTRLPNCLSNQRPRAVVSAPRTMTGFRLSKVPKTP